VKLWAQDGDLASSCTCPMGTDGAFCKHCVAVGLAWLDQGSGATSGKRAKPSVTMDDVRAYLAARGKEALVALLMEQAMEDDRLCQRLLMKAARKTPKGLDLATYRQAIDRAVDLGEFVEYGAARDYAEGIDEVIDSIEELLKEGHAPGVVELTEHALVAVEDAMGSVDDSDGRMGGIVERLQELHHAACKRAKPDPETLARRLFEWELRTPWDTFYGLGEVRGRPGPEGARRLSPARGGGVGAGAGAGAGAGRSRAVREALPDRPHHGDAGSDRRRRGGRRRQEAGPLLPVRVPSDRRDVSAGGIS
jgi:hypothetical protein